MKYTDYLQITLEEKKDHLALLLLLDQEQGLQAEHLVKILDRVRNANIQVIVKLALSLPLFDNLCKDPRLDAYWRHVWQSYGQVCTAPAHIFDLIKGMHLFRVVEQKKDLNKPEAREFLKKAIELNCFPALDAYAQYYLEKSNQEVTKDDLDEMLALCAMAESHQRPGLLLCARLYHKLFLITQTRFGGQSASCYATLAQSAREKAASIETKILGVEI